jgi:hypothetical protein
VISPDFLSPLSLSISSATLKPTTRSAPERPFGLDRHRDFGQWFVIAVATRPLSRHVSTSGLELQMRYAFIAMMAFIAGILISGAPSRAAPGPILKATAWNVAGVIQKVDYWRHYYRRHGVDDWHRYYRPPAPLTPVRPLSCGEFRFWDGKRCVDVRFR